MERPWAQELEEYLETKFRVVVDPQGPKLGLRIVPSFGQDEAKFFLLGLETGLLEVDENGYLRHGFATAEHEVRMVDLFRLGGPRPELCRGLITSAALAAELVLDRGWLRQQVHLAPIPEAPPEIAADVEIKSVEGKLLVTVFLERTAHQVAKLKRDLEQCGK